MNCNNNLFSDRITRIQNPGKLRAETVPEHSLKKWQYLFGDKKQLSIFAVPFPGGAKAGFKGFLLSLISIIDEQILIIWRDGRVA